MLRERMERNLLQVKFDKAGSLAVRFVAKEQFDSIIFRQSRRPVYQPGLSLRNNSKQFFFRRKTKAGGREAGQAEGV